MINNRFALYQVKREIRRNGTTLTFMRHDKNEFGEPVGEPYVFCTYTGLYHEHNPHMLDSYRYLNGLTDGLYRTEKMPQLMVPFEDFYFTDRFGNTVCVDVGDEVNLNGRLLRVTGTLNVQEWNMLVDISFEEVDVGGSTGKNASR